jgi:hypothetical protein
MPGCLVTPTERVSVGGRAWIFRLRKPSDALWMHSIQRKEKRRRAAALQNLAEARRASNRAKRLGVRRACAALAVVHHH